MSDRADSQASTTERVRQELNLSEHLRNMHANLQTPLSAREITAYLNYVRDDPAAAQIVLNIWCSSPPQRGQISKKEAEGAWDLLVTSLVMAAVICLLKHVQQTQQIEFLLALEKLALDLGDTIKRYIEIMSQRGSIRKSIDGILQGRHFLSRPNESKMPAARHFLVFEGIRTGLQMMMERPEYPAEITELYKKVLGKLLEIHLAYTQAKRQLTGPEQTDLGRMVAGSMQKMSLPLQTE